MKNNYMGKWKVFIFLTLVVLLFSMASCATTKRYPYFITRVQAGGQNEWVRQDISESGNTGTIYTQLVPLTADRAALITVGKINNMLVSQVIITIIPGSIGHIVNWTFIELEDNHFDANMRAPRPWDDAIYISILDKKKFIKKLQQPQTYNAKIMFNMNIYRRRINGNLESF